MCLLAKVSVGASASTFTQNNTQQSYVIVLFSCTLQCFKFQNTRPLTPCPKSGDKIKQTKQHTCVRILGFIFIPHCHPQKKFSCAFGPFFCALVFTQLTKLFIVRHYFSIRGPLWNRVEILTQLYTESYRIIYICVTYLYMYMYTQTYQITSITNLISRSYKTP